MNDVYGYYWETGTVTSELDKPAVIHEQISVTGNCTLDEI